MSVQYLKLLYTVKPVRRQKYVAAAGSMLNDSETIALCKIILESRAFTKEEMIPIINKLMSCCAHPKSRRKAFDYISGELDCYIEPNHHKNLYYLAAHKLSVNFQNTVIFKSLIKIITLHKTVPFNL